MVKNLTGVSEFRKGNSVWRAAKKTITIEILRSADLQSKYDQSKTVLLIKDIMLLVS